MQHEVGASVIAGVQLRTVKTDKGVIDPDEVEKNQEKIFIILLPG